MEEDRKRRGWLKGFLYLLKNGKREYISNTPIPGYSTLDDLLGRDQEWIWIQGKPISRVHTRYSPHMYYGFLGFQKQPSEILVTDEEYVDYDSVIGHWIEGAVYVWKHNSDWKKCERLYIVPKLTSSNKFSSTKCKQFFDQILVRNVSGVYDLRVQGRKIMHRKIFYETEQLYQSLKLQMPDFEAIFSSPKNYITSVSKAKLTPLKPGDDLHYPTGPSHCQNKECKYCYTSKKHRNKRPFKKKINPTNGTT